MISCGSRVGCGAYASLQIEPGERGVLVEDSCQAERRRTYPVSLLQAGFGVNGSGDVGRLQRAGAVLELFGNFLQVAPALRHVAQDENERVGERLDPGGDEIDDRRLLIADIEPFLAQNAPEHAADVLRVVHVAGLAFPQRLVDDLRNRAAKRSKHRSVVG